MLSDEEIKAIYERGKQNDLTDCHYGLFHDNKTYLQTTSYYYFLSGLVSHANAERIIEIGTFRGGSTKALSSGFGQADGSVISYDIKDFEPDFAGIRVSSRTSEIRSIPRRWSLPGPASQTG